MDSSMRDRLRLLVGNAWANQPEWGAMESPEAIKKHADKIIDKWAKATAYFDTLPSIKESK